MALNLHNSTYSFLSINSFMASYFKDCSKFCNIYCMAYNLSFSSHLQDFYREVISKE